MSSWSSANSAKPKSKRNGGWPGVSETPMPRPTVRRHMGSSMKASKSVVSVPWSRNSTRSMPGPPRGLWLTGMINSIWIVASQSPPSGLPLLRGPTPRNSKPRRSRPPVK